MQAVILAGGRGLRLQPYTATLPKPLMPVGDVPIIEIIIRQLKHHGIRDIIVSTGYLSQLITACLGTGTQYGVRIRYSTESRPLGTAGPLSRIRRLGSSFLVMNGDLLTTLDFRDLVRRHKNNTAAATTVVTRRRLQIHSGVVSMDTGLKMTAYTEKPVHTMLVGAGIHVFTRDVLRYINRRGPMNIPDLFNKLIAAGKPPACYLHTSDWLDIGNPDDYAEAVERFRKHRDRYLPAG